ncbi:MAG: hypothetical protein K6L76_00285 [Agarilytica sp.]
MSTASIILTIVAVLGVLVSYAFIQQSVQTKREHKARLLNALKSRARSFKFMNNGFPDGFLNKELKILIQRSLADVCEQLSRIEPSDPTHMQDLQVVNTHLADTQRLPGKHTPTPLENPQQIKDARASLEELHKFIHKLETKQTIPRNQAQLLRNQVKALALQVTIDGHCLNGTQAKQAGKARLAYHYFDLAANLLKRDPNASHLRHREGKIHAILEQLKEQLTEDQNLSPLSGSEQEEAAEIEDEWNKFSETSDVWKKKNVYD